MSDPRTARQAEALKQLRRRQRAKRGLVASYIHTLSARHGRRPEPAERDARAALGDA